MNKDIRFPTNFQDDPRFVKLLGGLGAPGFVALVTLWCWAALHRPKGRLVGMEARELARLARWEGEPRKLVATLKRAGFLSGRSKGYELYNWEIDQPWVWQSEERSAIAKANATQAWTKKRKELANAPSPPPDPYPSPSPFRLPQIENTANPVYEPKDSRHLPTRKPPSHRTTPDCLDMMITELEAKDSRSEFEQRELERLREKRNQGQKRTH